MQKNKFWGIRQSDFFSFFVGLLQINSVRYFILRNYEELPENNLGKDVDVVIEPGKYQIVARALSDTMKHFGVHYYTINKFDKLRCWYIMDNNSEFAIHIDVIENEIYKGFEFYSFDLLYAHVVKYKDFFVLDPVFDTVMLLVQNLVAYKSLKPRYIQVVSKNYSLYKTEITNEIINFFGEEVGGDLVKKLETSDYYSLVQSAQKLSKVAMQRIFLKKPIKTIIGFIRYLCGLFYRVLICPQKFRRFIAVEAPDGAGKTTFINALVKRLQFYFVCDEEIVSVCHFRPSILPNLGAVGEKIGAMKQDVDFTNPHRAKVVGRFSSFCRMFYYWSDYVLGIPYILRKNAKKCKYVIFDRYIYDFLVDPQRSRINLPLFVRKLFVRLVLQPKIIFVLTASPDVIFSRKQELTKQEILEQLGLFKDLCLVCENCYEVDAERSVDEIVDNAIGIMFNKFMNKVE